MLLALTETGDGGKNLGSSVSEYRYQFIPRQPLVFAFVVVGATGAVCGNTGSSEDTAG